MNEPELSVIIPAYNEEAFMSLTLQSLVEQTVLPTKIVVVNDNSTDKTPEIVSEFASKYPFITLVNKKSDAIHLPGSKVIQAFHEGEKNIDKVKEEIYQNTLKYIKRQKTWFKRNSETIWTNDFDLILKESQNLLKNS